MALLVCAGTVLGSSLRSRTPYAVKDTHHVPKSWKAVGPAPADHMIRIQIGLKQGQFSELERHLYEVSDPSHERYGQHLSSEEVDELVKPTDETFDQVHEWLDDCGVDSSQLEYSSAKDWIKVTLRVKDIERLLDTKYSVFKHKDGSHLIRTPQWSLPIHLHGHIDTIQPTNSFFQPKPKRSTLKTAEVAGLEQYLSGDPVSPVSKATVAEACNITAVTPTCLRTLYGTIDYVPKSLDKNQIVLCNYLGEANNRSDVNIFLSRFRPDAAGAGNNFTVTTIDGGNDQQTPLNSSGLAAKTDLEGNLDAETIIGITYPTKLFTFNTGGKPPFIPDHATPTDTNEPYLTWVQFILSQTTIPQVISTSYGDDEQSIPLSFATSVCNSFAQLGARGVTLIFSSGDSGVGGDTNCVTNDGKNTSTFLPAFPAACPFVTTVGATKNVNPEIVAVDAGNGFVSGGGFSNYFPRPAYQDKVVPAYITSLKGQFKNLFNASGRGYPDIAAQGFHFLVVWNGTLVSLDGTSASAPTIASVIALVNDMLLAAGKPVLGFLNPWLYSGGSASFTDITSGSASGCGTTGFPAQAGWDAVTGFGTPFFPKFQAAAMNNGIFRLSPRGNVYTMMFVTICLMIMDGL